MTRGLLIGDVQNDFTEGGALACEGGTSIAVEISAFVGAERESYAVVVASRDWHDPESDNGGHFSDTPDWVNSWPVHCVANTIGAEYHRALDVSHVDVHVLKGQGVPAYSAFDGRTDDGRTIPDVFAAHEVDAVDIVGIATDYCVRATALDAIAAGFSVTVKANLCVGVNPATSIAALAELAAAGVKIMISDRVAS